MIMKIINRACRRCKTYKPYQGAKTVRKILLPTIVLSISFLVSSCGEANSSAGAGGGDEIAATVNGEKILIKDVDRVLAQQFGGQENQLSQIQQAMARIQALDNLITQEALYQQAKKDNIVPSEDEINKAIQNSKVENALTEEKFQEELKKTNLTEEQFRESIKKQLSIQKLIEKAYDQITLQEQEINSYYNANPKQFSLQPGVALSDIVIDPNDNGAKFDAKGEAQAEQRARDLKARLAKGDDFATLARTYSEHQSAYQSGDIGFLPRSEFATALPQQMGLQPALGDRLYTMEPGNVTEPIKDAAGRWHILKITGKQTEARDRSLDDPNVRKMIQDDIRAQRRQALAASIQARTRDEAKIENFLARRMLENPNSFGVLRPVPGANPGAKPAADTGAASASPSPTAEAKK
jgi:parvulin-like peptidyl-prolyl isomerase